jgi:hypothetical protein
MRVYRISEYSFDADFLRNHDAASIEAMPLYLMTCDPEGETPDALHSVAQCAALQHDSRAGDCSPWDARDRSPAWDACHAEMVAVRARVRAHRHALASKTAPLVATQHNVLATQHNVMQNGTNGLQPRADCLRRMALQVCPTSRGAAFNCMECAEANRGSLTGACGNWSAQDTMDGAGSFAVRATPLNGS